MKSEYRADNATGTGDKAIGGQEGDAVQESDTCPTRLLSDEPASSDAFGSHERLAGALAELVAKETGGRAIALEGSWGSGKSSVINFLKQCLDNRSDSSQYGVFVFDTWAHRGDPLRRSFLEELVAYVEGKWIPEGTWADELAELSGRMEHHEITREPRLTSQGKWVIGSLLLAPLGYAITAASMGTEGGVNLAALTVGFVLSLLPLLVVAGVTLYDRYCRDSANRPESGYQGSYLSLFVNRIEDRTTTTTVSTPDPTSLEFHKKFEAIVGDALENEDRTLITVIDNLDRIDAERALTIWSTMRTFFEFRRLHATNWFEHFWIIVPFDRNGLRTLWAAEVGDESDWANSSGDAVEAFLEKSFQVRFYVPSPVTSDWRTYFGEQLEEALRQHTDPDQKYRLSRMYELFCQREKTRITPRNVKLFINELGAVHRQWSCDEVPLELQALYVVLRDRIDEDIRALEKAELADDGMLNLLHERDWRKYIAGLHFNVKPERAMQVWMGSRVQELMTDISGDNEELAQVARIPGFGLLVEQIIEDQGAAWAEAEPIAIAAVARSLRELENPFPDDVAREKRIWKSLLRHSQRVSSWPNFNREIADDLVTIVSHSPPESIPAVGRALLESSRESVKDRTEEEQWEHKAWIGGFATLIEALSDSEIDLEKLAFVPGDESTYLTVVETMTDMEVKEPVRRYFRPDHEMTSVLSEFGNQIEADRVREADVGVIDHLVEIGAASGWEEVRDAITSRIHQSASEADIRELAVSMVCLVHLVARGVVAKADLNSVCRQQSHVLHRLRQLSQKNNDRGVAAAVLLMVLVNPDASINQHVGNGADGESIYKQILQTSEATSGVVEEIGTMVQDLSLFDQLIEDGAVTRKPLTGAIVKKLTSDRTIGTLISVEQVAKKWDLFDDYLTDNEFNQFVDQAIESTSLVSHLLDRGFDRIDAKLYEAVLTAVESEEDAERFRTFLVEGIQDVDADTWLEELEQEGNLVELSFLLLKQGRQDDFGSSFKTALEKHRDRVASQETMPTRYEADWEEFLTFLGDTDRLVFIRDTVDRLLDDGANIDGLLKLYGDAVRSEDSYLREVSDRVVRRLFRNIINEGSRDTIVWLHEVLEENADILSSATDATVDDFKERLQGQLEELSEKRDDGEIEARVAELELLAERLGIDLTGNEEEHGAEPKADRGSEKE